MNDVKYVKYVCRIFRRVVAEMLGVVGVGAGNSQSGVDAGGGEEGEWICLCVTTSRLDLSSSPLTGDEKLGRKERVPSPPLETTLKETEMM